MRLARRLHARRPARRRRCSPACSPSGMLPLFIAGLAARCGLDHGAAWEVLADPRGRGPALLLRAAGIERDEAAAILLALNSRGPARLRRRGRRHRRRSSSCSTRSIEAPRGRCCGCGRPIPPIAPASPASRPAPARRRGRMTRRRRPTPPVTGRVDAEGRLVAADPPLAALHAQAGGERGRRARRAADRGARPARPPARHHHLPRRRRRRRRAGCRPLGPRRARRRGGRARHHRLDRPPGPRRRRRRRRAEREADFLRAAADWTWETDDTLRLTSLVARRRRGDRPRARRADRQAAHPPVPLPRERATARCRSSTALAEHKPLRRPGRRAARRPQGPLSCSPACR